MLPILSFAQNSIMLHKALVHDRKIYKCYFGQDLFFLKRFEEGELVSRLDDDIRFFRFAITD